MSTTYDLQIRASGPLTEENVADLERMGLRLETSLGQSIYRVRGQSTATMADLLTLPFIESVEPCAAESKLDAALLGMVGVAGRSPAISGSTDSHSADADSMDSESADMVTVLVSLDPATPPVDGQQMDDLGEVVGDASPRRARMRISRSRIADLAERGDVLAIEIDPDVTTQNNVARTLTKVDTTTSTLGLDGSGEIVGVADSGLDTGDPATVLADFSGRVINIRSSTPKQPPFAAFDAGSDLNNHGTHVCGSIAGDGSNSNGTITGMASAAELTVLAMGPNTSTGLVVPSDLTTGVFTDAYNDGARIHSNSWGSNSGLGTYTAFSQDVDEFAWNNRDMLIVVAAGNSGPGASTVGAPGTAKNCLTVGASESVRPLPPTISINPNPQDQDFNPGTPPVNVPLSLGGIDEQADDSEDIAVFSGRGPVVESGVNRIKPDVVAPGSWILSCRSSESLADVGPDGLAHTGNLATFYADDSDGSFTHSEAVGRGLPGQPFFGAWNENTPAPPVGAGPLAADNYFYSSGTSMATPVTSGVIALVRQYLREQRGISDPSAALVKAMVVNGATVPAGASNDPDNARGFGWVDMENICIPAPTGQQTFSDDAELAVATGNVRNFSIGVADTSEPLRVTMVWTDRAGAGLQNRLYLRVTAPDGTITDGDVTAFPNPTNNTQRVHIAAPMVGTYTVSVHGVDVPFGVPGISGTRQDFALSVINGIGFSPEPVDIVQVIDHSGSMGFYGFMEPAKERSKQLVDVLRINDSTGVVQFDNIADLVTPLTLISGFTDQNDIKGDITAITPGGSTSIGAGLEMAVGDLAASGDPAHPQAIVLLSDGHENAAPWVGGGVTDSPPSWYSGPNTTEVLPSVPADTKVYTVSLGTASDEVMLQEIATARGGLYQSVDSAADVAKLHEIYVHLQALAGGEEVIAAGSDATMAGLGSSNGTAGVGAGLSAGIGTGLSDVVSVGAADTLDHLNITTLSPLQRFPEPDWLRELLNRLGRGKHSPSSTHSVSVDESVSSVAFVVSWHDPSQPVELYLTTPSLKKIKSTSPSVQTVAGTSYFMYRIDNPEPGIWQLRVRASNRQEFRPRARHYTWGVHGTTPVGLAVAAPKKPVGRKEHKILAELIDSDDIARGVRLRGTAQVPRASVKDLIREHRDELAELPLPEQFDKRSEDEGRVRLVLLDLLRAATGLPSVFSREESKVALSGRGQKVGTVATLTDATTAVELEAVGKSREGHQITRLARFDIRS